MIWLYEKLEITEIIRNLKKSKNVSISIIFQWKGRKRANKKTHETEGDGINQT